MTEQADVHQFDYSLKGFLLAAILWLPLAFFVWFYLAPILVMPVGWLLEVILTTLHEGLFEGVRRTSYLLEVGALLTLPDDQGVLRRAAADIPVNPMIYGYGLPLILGLAMSTPTTIKHRTLQAVIGYLLIMLISVWGSYFETFRTLAFNMAEPGATLIAAAGLTKTGIAAGYQFGYLILPAVVPVVAWIVMNRNFIESMIRETHRPEQGQ